MEGIRPARPDDHARITEVWEASVRATHDFLPASAISALRPLIGDYLLAVQLCVYDDARGTLQGFLGVAGEKIEMLFIAPQARGAGIGARLLRHAVEDLGANALDVNEQNPQAVGFYQHQGFIVTGRSPLDGQGQPHPLLHMRLARL